ncbi:MAG: hypothetical protein U9R19_03115 [Bacteroidota bacterium]|nr:hypothetical protein [Bacteroidota bacterium]
MTAILRQSQIINQLRVSKLRLLKKGYVSLFDKVDKLMLLITYTFRGLGASTNYRGLLCPANNDRWFAHHLHLSAFAKPDNVKSSEDIDKTKEAGFYTGF